MITFNRLNTKQPEPDPSLKGVFLGNCNRTACQKPIATWYNSSTEK